MLLALRSFRFKDCLRDSFRYEHTNNVLKLILKEVVLTKFLLYDDPKDSNWHRVFMFFDKCGWLGSTIYSTGTYIKKARRKWQIKLLSKNNLALQ